MAAAFWRIGGVHCRPSSVVMSGRDYCSNSQLLTFATAPPIMAAIYDNPSCVPASITVTHWPGIACNGAGPFPVSWNYEFGESSSLSLLYSNSVCIYSSCIGVPLQDVQVFTFTPGTLPAWLPCLLCGFPHGVFLLLCCSPWKSREWPLLSRWLGNHFHRLFNSHIYIDITCAQVLGASESMLNLQQNILAGST